MVRTFSDAATFKAFTEQEGGLYRVAWAKTMQVITDKDTGKQTETSLCDYMLERYNYKPSVDIVLNDIFASGCQASMAEIKEISEGLGAEPMEPMRQAMLRYITQYDSSPSVNSFSLNGASVWLDKDTRVGLMNSTNIAKAMGQDKTTLWLGETKIEVGCDKAIQLLSALEMYALECFNVTAAHKKAVAELKTADDVLRYDYTTGYPAKLTMEV